MCFLHDSDWWRQFSLWLSIQFWIDFEYQSNFWSQTTIDSFSPYIIYRIGNILIAVTTKSNRSNITCCMHVDFMHFSHYNEYIHSTFFFLLFLHNLDCWVYFPKRLFYRNAFYFSIAIAIVMNNKWGKTINNNNHHNYQFIENKNAKNFQTSWHKQFYFANRIDWLHCTLPIENKNKNKIELTVTRVVFYDFC